MSLFEITDKRQRSRATIMNQNLSSTPRDRFQAHGGQPAEAARTASDVQARIRAADPHGRYAIAALVWLPQQASPVHAHHTWCGYAVLDGSLNETIFEWNGARQCASAARTQARNRGAVSFARGGRGAIHRLGNGTLAPAVSLHVYGVPGARIATHVNDIVRVAEAPARV